MGKTACALVIVVMMICGTAAASPTTPSAPCSLELRVENHAEISVAILADAETRASTVFALAGIRTVWLHDAARPASDCRLAVQLLLLSRPMAEHKIVCDNARANVLGQAVPAARRVYVYWFRIEAASGFSERLAADVLGNVIAHEVGHVLLPDPGHSLQGIMRATLNPLHLQRQFTEPQAEAIRARLARSGW